MTIQAYVILFWASGNSAIPALKRALDPREQQVASLLSDLDLSGNAGVTGDIGFLTSMSMKNLQHVRPGSHVMGWKGDPFIGDPPTPPTGGGPFNPDKRTF